MGHKFLNDASAAVTEMLEGFVQSHPGVKFLDGFPDVKVVVRSHVDKNKVALVSGGGSGHEPAHAGFVGDGMLDAAVCGDVFASPSVAAVLAAIRHVTGSPGCLLIVKNYTGDRLNFGLAAERAKLEGLNVEMVVVADDCALPPPLGVAGGADSRARSSCTSARAPPPPPGIHSSSSPRKPGPRRTPWARWGSRRRLTRYLGKMNPRGPSRPASSRWASGSTANQARSPLPPRP